MAGNKELEDGLRTMAEDFHLPGGGRMKLSWLVAEHLRWFDAAERRGMGWRDMIGALAAAGVTGRTGKHLSIGTLSSTVWRERDKAKQSKPSATRETRSPQPLVMSRTQERERPSKHRRRSEIPTPTTETALSGSVRERQVGSKNQNSTTKDVLAFMDRARAVRQRPK